LIARDEYERILAARAQDDAHQGKWQLEDTPAAIAG
jgi:hypothetical protein